MTNQPRFLAIDLSSDGIVLALFSKDGSFVDSVKRSVQTAEDGSQQPQDWWRAVRTGTKDLLRRTKTRKDDIRALGLSGPDHGLVAVGAEGDALAPCYLKTTDEQAAWSEGLTERIGARNLLNLAGASAIPGCLAADLLWLQHGAPRVWHDLHKALLPRDFLRLRLTDAVVTDPSAACSTRLFSPRSRSWSKQILDRAGINAAWMPEIASGHLLSGRVTPTAAKETGLVAGTPVVVGVGRAAGLAVATGVLDAGQMLIELGDQGQCLAVRDSSPRNKDSDLFVGCHALPDRWTLENIDAGSGAGLRWFTEELAATDVQQWRRAGNTTLEAMTELASEVPPGSDGLHYLPPSKLGGGLVGLTPKHGRSHVFRALLESVAYQLRETVDRFIAAGCSIDSIQVTGPGSENTLWCQIVADALGRPVSVHQHDQAVLAGAAILAATAVGSHKSLTDACRKRAPVGTTFEPRRAASEAYEEGLPIHEAFAETLGQVLEPGDEL